MAKAAAHAEGKLSGGQFCREGSGGAGGHKVDHKQQCTLWTKKANIILTFIVMCIVTTCSSMEIDQLRVTKMTATEASDI